MKALVALLLVFLWIAFAQARVQVAFVEIRRPDGTLVQLEPGGRFAHLAISYRGQWLHSHPYRGVELINTNDLAKMGTLAVKITLPAMEPSDGMVKGLVGLPYDREYSWSNERMYCSELVAKILQLKPSPMYFDPKLWPKEYQKLNGQLGISPDDIYRILAHPIFK